MKSSCTKRPAPLLLSLGEPAGIGPDCVLHAWMKCREIFDQVIVAAPVSWLKQRAEVLGLSVPLHRCTDISEESSPNALNIWNPCSQEAENIPIRCGKASPGTAETVIECIEKAARQCLAGRAAGLVTGPIEKAVLREAGFDFPGHTEFLADIAGNPPHVMMLASHALRVALLTTHLPLKDVPQSLSTQQTLQSIRVVHEDLYRRFSIATPRLALAALNPHAGERGHFGREEIDILAPAIRLAQKQGIHIEGPLAADSLFAPTQRTRFDAIICCYHDQGLIPIKALCFGEAVNITLGLPFIRTSVDHGTALDRAGTNEVSCNSLIAAIEMAQSLARISHAPNRYRLPGA